MKRISSPIALHFIKQHDVQYFWHCKTQWASSQSTVESSLFVGHQCLLLSWVTLAHEFTFPRRYIQAFVRYLLKLSWTFYQRSYVLTEPGKILLPTNKNDSAVIYGGVYILTFTTCIVNCKTSPFFTASGTLTE